MTTFVSDVRATITNSAILPYCDSRELHNISSIKRRDHCFVGSSDFSLYPRSICHRKTPLLRGSTQRQASQEVQGHLGIAFWSLTSCGGLLHTAAGLQLRKGASLEEFINLQSCTPLIMRLHVKALITEHWVDGKKILPLCMKSGTGGTQDRPLLPCQNAQVRSTGKVMTHLGNGALADTLHMADLLPRSDLLRVCVDDICHLFEGYSLEPVVCRVARIQQCQKCRLGAAKYC